MANEYPTKHVLKGLVDHLSPRMTEIQEFHQEFPSANIALKLPSLAITSGPISFMPYSEPRIFTKSAVDENNASTIVWIVGQYDWKLQIDLFCRNKEERHAIYQSFFKAFNRQLPVLGASVVLSGYHNFVCRYDLTQLRYEDSEVASQTREWRATCDVVANCYAALDTQEYIIQTTELTLETDTNQEI